MRARTSGSSGEAKGSFSMMTSRSASPFTSTPSQKLAVPSSTRVAVGAKPLQQLLARRLALHEQAVRRLPRAQRARSNAAPCASAR